MSARGRGAEIMPARVTNSGKISISGNAVAPTGYSITSLLGRAVAAEGFAALDRVGDVLGHVAQFGEFREVASAGDMRVDEPGRHQPEAVSAARLFVRRLMGGPLLSNRRLGLTESG